MNNRMIICEEQIKVMKNDIAWIKRTVYAIFAGIIINIAVNLLS